MILTVKKRGARFSKLDFWKAKDTLDIGRVAVFVGANGCGKTSTLEAIWAGYDLHDPNSALEHYQSSSEVGHDIGVIETNPRFEVVLRHRGDLGNMLPGAVFTEEDWIQCSVSKRSHGEAGILRTKLWVAKLDKCCHDGTSCLLLLDELEAGASAEAQTIMSKSISNRLQQYENVSAIIVTQSDRVRAEFLKDGLGEEVDFGGWLIGNPWRLNEVHP